MSMGLRHGSYADVLTDCYGKVDLVVTSPPYNIGSQGPARTGQRRFGKFDPKSYGGVRDYADSKQEDVYQEEQKGFILWAIYDLLKSDGVLVYNHKPRRKRVFRPYGVISPWEWIIPLQSAGKIVVREEIIWDRITTHNHDKRYVYPQTERLFVIHRPGAKPFFRNYDPSGRNKGLGDVWKIPLMFRTVRNCCFHPEIPRRCIEMWSKRGDLVCDPFSGSGTTMLEAIRTGRRFVGSEIQKKAYDLAMTRLRSEISHPPGV